MLKTLYTGSSVIFDEFDLTKIGSASGIDGAGYGFYFTTSQIDAFAYGDNMYTCKVNLKKAISNTAITINQDFIAKLFGFTELSGFVSLEKIYSISINALNNYKTDTDIIKHLVEDIFKSQLVKILPILSFMGYNYTTDKETPESDDFMHYILFDPKDIVIESIQTINDL